MSEYSETTKATQHLNLGATLAGGTLLREAFAAAKNDVYNQSISDAEIERIYLKTREELRSAVRDYESDLACLQVFEMLDGGSPTPVVTPSGYRKKPIPANLRWAVFKRDGYRCVRCLSEEDLAADHIYSELMGGEATLDNLQTLCRRCNAKKGAR